MASSSKKNYQKKIKKEFKDIFESITEAIESVNKNLDCEIKWGRLTYGLQGDYHHWICGISQTKKSINVTFHFGGILKDKEKYFIVGESLFLRKLEYSAINSVDTKVIKDFVKQAINKLDYFKANWKTLNSKKK